MLADYPGTLIVVSHDRDFLDRVATSVVISEGEGVWREYAGGYSDMVAQRGFGVEALKSASQRAEPKAKPAAREKPAGKPRLSFNERHALATLPEKIEALRKERAALEAVLADPALYASDPKKFATASARLHAAQTELAEAEERWLELEIRREEIEG